MEKPQTPENQVTGSPREGAELPQSYQQLQKRARLWNGLSTVSHVISSTLEPEEVLRLILDQAVQILHAEGGFAHFG